MKKLSLLLFGLLISAFVFSQTYHSGTIGTNETWSVAGNPHIISGNTTVANAITLTIDPGVEVYFGGNYRLLVNGTLSADGEDANHILFTSNSLIPGAGDWRHIYLDDADAGTILDYCDISYGGSATGMILIRNSANNVQISNCSVNYSATLGIRYQNNTANPAISDCSFDNNADYPIRTYVQRIADITGSNSFTNNTPNAIYVAAGTVATNSTWVKQGVPYVVNGNITVADLVNLTLDPGVEIHFLGNRTFTVNGSLTADGLSWDRIIFSSAEGTPAAGDWNRLYFNDAETSSVTYCNFYYAGSGSSAVDVRNSGSNVTIDNVDVFYSDGYGLYSRNGSTPLISNCTIMACANYPVYVIADGAKNLSGTFSLSSNLDDAIWVQGGTVNTGTWSNLGVPYILGGNSFTVADGQQLDIDAGVTMKIDGNRNFTVQGTLVADGEDGNPVTFTSNESTPAKGDWGYIYFNTADAGCMLDYCDISYGGSGSYMVYMNNTPDNVAISNCNFSNSGAIGLYHRTNATASISDCSFTDCDGFAIRTAGNQVKDITGNMVFSGNTPSGIRVDAQDITTATWLDFGVPYVMWADMNIADANTLTISQDCELQFNTAARLQVLGALDATGAVDHEIVFTSHQATPAQGDWEQLYFNGSDAGTTLSYCTISYGGSNQNGAVYFANGANSLTFMNCTVDNSETYGINVNANNTVAPTITSCTLTNNNNYPIRTYGDFVKSLLGTMSFAGNTPDKIRVESQNIFSGVWLDHGVPYVLMADMNLIDGNTLIVMPGTELQLNSEVRLRVYGTLLANGTEADRIVFTSNQDVPTAGYWERLLFDGADAGTLLNYCDVMYGGQTLGGIDINNCGTNVTITNSTVSQSATTGIQIRNGSEPTITTTSVTTNNQEGVYIAGNSGVTFGSSEAEWNEIYGNGSYELRNGSNDIDAMYIYWGTTACNGVSDLIFDELDQGNLGLVDYIPYLDASHMIPDVTTTWTGLAGSDWADNGNWDNSTPCGSISAVIPAGTLNEPVVSSDETCYDLTVEPNATLTVNSPSSYLAVRGDLMLEADASGYASLLDDYGVTVTGNSTSEYYISEDRWHFLSPSMTGQTANSFFGMYLYSHDELTNTFVNIVDETTPLNVGQGYEVWSYSTSTGNQTVEFTGGTLNTGTHFLPVTNAGSGWNFVGNPFPSAIGWDHASWVKAFIDATVWVWDGTQYLTWNGTSGWLSGGIIPAMQGFFVKANGATPAIAVGNAARLHGVGAYKSSVSEILELTITGNGYNDKTFVNFMEDATDGYDSNYDGEKLYGITEAPQLYTFIGEEIMSVNVLKGITEELIVPMGLEVGAETEYTILASELSSFGEDVEIYLEDMQENAMINLKLQGDYTFMATPGAEAHRFNIHFLKSSSDIEDVVDANVSIYSYANSVYVKNLGEDMGKAMIQIYNISGQKVYESNLQEIPVNRFDLNLRSGYYVVKVVSENSINSEKVFIK